MIYSQTTIATFVSTVKKKQQAKKGGTP